MNTLKFAVFLFILQFSTACSQSDPAPRLEAETNATKQEREAVAMVVTANPLATETGLNVLRAGGSAVDAAIALQATLSLVEPQSSGIGGGGFMVYYDAKTKTIEYYNGREKAPMAVTPGLFLQEDGKQMSRRKAKDSGLSIGVPGVLALFRLAHADHGKLPWHQLFDQAKGYATKGFKVSPRMNKSIRAYEKYFYRDPANGPTDLYDYLFIDDQPLPVGHVLKNPEYAKSLEIIAADPDSFYKGDLAKAIIASVQREPLAGSLSMQDMADYSAVKRDPYCSSYRAMTLCGSALPSSWVSVSMVMSLLNEAPKFSPDGAKDPANWTLLAEALRITYADNNEYIADDDFIEVPIEGMMSEAYIKERAKLISRDGANPDIKAGNPWLYQQQDKAAQFGQDATHDDVGTTHFVIVDREGNVVSMTSTVEGYFGSTRMAGGMILNNQLTDFSFRYEDDEGNPIANAVAPGKRPRSSMSPTIVLDENRDFVMAVGSPGGRNIISYVAKTVVGIMRWGLSPQEAIDLPNMVAKTQQVRIEKHRADREIIDALRDFGYNVYESEGEISGLSAVVRRPDGTLEGGADPRREGTVGILFADELQD